MARRQLGNVRLRKGGRWEARVMVDGKTTSIYGKSGREVEKRLAEVGRYITLHDTEPEKRTLYDLSRPHKALDRICAKLGGPVIRIHDFRHLHTSIALEHGAPLALVSRRLGRANTAITASIYTHALSDGRGVSDLWSKVVGG